MAFELPRSVAVGRACMLQVSTIPKASMCRKNGVFPKLAVPIGGSHSKEYRVLGSILGSPYSGKVQNGWFQGIICMV